MSESVRCHFLVTVQYVHNMLITQLIIYHWNKSLLISSFLFSFHCVHHFNFCPPHLSLVSLSTSLSWFTPFFPAAFLTVSQRGLVVMQGTVRKSLWVSTRLSLSHPSTPIQSCFFFFNSVGCYLKLSFNWVLYILDKIFICSMNAGWECTIPLQDTKSIYTICTWAWVCMCVCMLTNVTAVC